MSGSDSGAEDAKSQIENFMESVMSNQNLSYILQEVLAEKGLELVQTINYLERDDMGMDQKKKQYVESGLSSYINKFRYDNGHSPDASIAKAQIQQLKHMYDSGEKQNYVIINTKNKGKEFEIPIMPKILSSNRKNRASGVEKYISLCTKGPNIFTSVEIYSSYVTFCNNNGYGVCSAPTLTACIRASDFKDTEVRSNKPKPRSHGWYITLPPSK